MLFGIFKPTKFRWHFSETIHNNLFVFFGTFISCSLFYFLSKIQNVPYLGSQTEEFLFSFCTEIKEQSFELQPFRMYRSQRNTKSQFAIILEPLRIIETIHFYFSLNQKITDHEIKRNPSYTMNSSCFGIRNFFSQDPILHVHEFCCLLMQLMWADINCFFLHG